MRIFALFLCFAMEHCGTISVPHERQSELSWSNSAKEKSPSDAKNDPKQRNEFLLSSEITPEEKMGDQQHLGESSCSNTTMEIFPDNEMEGYHAGPVVRLNKSAELLQEEKLKELRIETVKLQILEHLGLKNPPPVIPKPTESSFELVRILLNEDKMENQPHPNDIGERLIIQAKNNGIKCSNSNLSNCRVFYFDINSALNTSSASLWIYRTDTNPAEKASITMCYSNESEEQRKEKVLGQEPNYGWNKIELPRILLPASSSSAFHSSVEVRGLHVETNGNRRPFLVVNKVLHSVSRQRRGKGCDGNDRCCMKPLRISLAEIGFSWVIYPLYLDVNMCSGKCMLDQSRMNTNYERALTAILDNNPSLHESLGVCWTLCCKPKQMEAVRVFYNDTEGCLHDHYIPKLTVKSCSCS